MPRVSSGTRRGQLFPEPVAAKVPEIIFLFWVIKVLTTAGGEATSDYLAVSLGSRLEAGAIEAGLGRAGYRRLAPPERFIVSGGYGPLRDGELDRARAWGAALAAALATKPSV